MADEPETPPTGETGAPTPPNAPGRRSDLHLDALEAAAGDGEALLKRPEQPEDLPTGHDLDAVYDIPVQLSAVLGRTTMQVSQLLKLGRGAVVELDRKVGEAIDIYVNNRLVARGEVVVVEERLGITMTEIIKGDSHAS
jgi:flagellar motor switch protein FliN